MTWKAYHNRGEILRAVIDTADVRRDGLLPMDVPGVRAAFADELDLLGALQIKWHTRLAGHIDRKLSAQPLDLEDAVATAWNDAAAEFAGVRLILDHYRAHPLDDAMAVAMTRATAKEHIFLAVMAGRSSVGDDTGRPIGASIEEHARTLHRGVRAVEPEAGAHRAGLLERLRAVIAA